MNCGISQKKNYNNDKPLSRRILQVILVFFVVWLIGFSHLAQAFIQPNKPKSKRRNKKHGYNKEQGFFGKISNSLHNGDFIIWGFVVFIIFGVILFVLRIIRMQIIKAEAFIQDKWEEAMAEQERHYNGHMGDYGNTYDSDDDYDGPRIRELTTEEEEAHWRNLMEKEKRERERQIAEIREEEKKTK